MAIGKRFMRDKQLGIALVLLLGLSVRLPFVAMDTHISADMGMYLRWGEEVVQAGGLAAIYDAGQTDSAYPPVSLYLFGGAVWAAGGGNGGSVAIIKLASMLADVLSGALIAWALWRRDPRLAVISCGLYLFNPGVWYVSAYWGQTDSIYTLLLLVSVVALERGSYVPAWVAYALALGTKWQSIALAPLVLFWTLDKGRVGKWKWVIIGPAAGMIVGLALAAPWLASGRVGELARVYTNSPEVPMVYVSGYNFWYLLFQERASGVSSLASVPGLPFSYQMAGVGLFCVLALVITIAGIRGDRGPTLPGAALNLGMFMLMTQIHERHMFAALAFLLLSAAQCRVEGGGRTLWGRGLWWAYGLLSLSFFFNLMTIAPFTPLLGGNLVADIIAGDGSLRVMVLRWLSVGAVIVNAGVLAWLVVGLWKGQSDRRAAKESISTLSA